MNDLAFIRNAALAPAILSHSELELQRLALVNPEIATPDNLLIEQGLMRFKLYSVDSDEMVNIMALSRIKPDSGQFDPHFYMYGGAYLYPLGAWYAALIKVGILDDPTLPALLADPNLVDRLYILGRLFILLAVTLAGFFLYRTARLFLPIISATLALMIFLVTPMTLTHSLLIKPHWWALLPTLIVIYYLTRLYLQKRLTGRSELFIGLGCGLAVGAATTYAPFTIIVWLALFYAWWHGLIRWRSLFSIPFIALAVFILSNPYIWLNFAAWQQETVQLRGWYQPAISFQAVLEFLRNSLLPGFGAAGAASLIIAIHDLFKHSWPRLMALNVAAVTVMAATLTSSTSYWHTNTRFVPYLLPLMILYLAARIPQRWLMLITALMIIQAVPHSLAFFDENSLQHSTRLQAARWLETNVAKNEAICARLVPYDTAPFDFTQYELNSSNCRYVVQVERERPVVVPEQKALLARFQPRLNRSPLPLITTHVNPQISIYENLATHK